MKRRICAVACALVAVSSCGLAQSDCADYGEYLHWVGSLPDRGVEGDVIVRGNLAFLSRFGLVVVDISNPEHPREIAQIYLGTETIGMDLLGGILYLTAYVAGGTGYLATIDVSEPYAPILLSQVEVESYPVDVAVSNGTAILACPNGKPVIIGVGDPGNPTVLGELATNGDGRGVGAGNDLSAICEDGGTVSFWDLSDQFNPAMLGSVAVGYSEPHDVIIDDGIAYVASGPLGVVIIDISDTMVPFVTGAFNTKSLAIALEIEGDVLYVADAEGGVGASYVSGIYSVDVSSPCCPEELGHRTVMENATEIGVENGIVCVSTRYFSGLQLFDGTNPETEPRNVGLTFYPWQYYRVAASKDRVLLFRPGNGMIRIVNIADPLAPFLEYGTPDFASTRVSTTHVALQDSWLYCVQKKLAGTIYYLSIYRYHPDDGPVRQSVTALDGSASGIAVHGNRMIVLVGERMEVFDVSYPVSPRRGASFDLGEWGRAVAIQGSTAVVGTNSEIIVVDVSDIYHPIVLGRLAMSAICFHILINGDYAVLSLDYGGIWIVDISDPSFPEVAGIFDPAARITATANSGDVLYGYLHGAGGGDLELSVLVISMEDPAAPRLIGSIGGYGITGLDVYEDWVFYCQETGSEAEFVVAPVQCDIVRVEDPILTHAGHKKSANGDHDIGACPNPFNSNATLNFDLAESGRTYLKVYDVAGRHVRTLVNGESLEAGSHEVVWNGRDDGGRAVAAGSYFFRLESVGPSRTGRMVLAK